jgi:GNAT superfamily N-acetyltransferase
MSEPFEYYHHQPSEKTHQVTAYNGNETVGYLRWAAQRMTGTRPGEILALRVRPDVRRQGIATEMFGRSQQFEQAAKHSSSRSPEGSAFAKSTGTRMPKLKKPIPSEESLGLSHESLMQMEQFGRQGRKI